MPAPVAPVAAFPRPKPPCPLLYSNLEAFPFVIILDLIFSPIRSLSEIGIWHMAGFCTQGRKCLGARKPVVEHDIGGPVWKVLLIYSDTSCLHLLSSA